MSGVNEAPLELAAWAVNVRGDWAIHTEAGTFLALLTDDGFFDELDARSKHFACNFNGNWTDKPGTTVFSLVPPYGDLRKRAGEFMVTRVRLLFHRCAKRAWRDGRFWRLDLEPHQGLANRTEIVDSSFVSDLCMWRNVPFNESAPEIDLRRGDDD